MPVSRNQLIPHQSPLCECQTHIYNISIVLLHNMQHLSPTLVSPRWLSMCWVSSLSCMTWGHNFVSQQPHCQTESEKTELIYNRTQSAQLVCACYLQIKTNTLQTSEGLLICNSPGPMQETLLFCFGEEFFSACTGEEDFSTLNDTWAFDMRRGTWKLLDLNHAPPVEGHKAIASGLETWQLLGANVYRLLMNKATLYIYIYTVYICYLFMFF